MFHTKIRKCVFGSTEGNKVHERHQPNIENKKRRDFRKLVLPTGREMRKPHEMINKHQNYPKCKNKIKRVFGLLMLTIKTGSER